MVLEWNLICLCFLKKRERKKIGIMAHTFISLLEDVDGVALVCTQKTKEVLV